MCVCANDGGVAREKQGSLLAALQSAGFVFYREGQKVLTCIFLSWEAIMILRECTKPTLSARCQSIKQQCFFEMNQYFEIQVFGPEISTYFTDPYTFLHFEVEAENWDFYIFPLGQSDIRAIKLDWKSNRLTSQSSTSSSSSDDDDSSTS